MKQLIRINQLYLLLLIILFTGPQCGKSKKEVIPVPSLSSVSPVKGIIGEPVTVNGQNMGNADKITFNSIASTIVSNTGTVITTVVPTGATTGMNKIVVQTGGGKSNELQFEVEKTPDNVDPAPPTLSKIIPAANFTEYPVLIYGDNLSGAIHVTFNDKEAVVYTNNKKVITATVPKDLPTGTVTVKVATVKGTSTLNFQVSGAPPAGPASVNFSIIAIPPPNYVPTISNDWTCGLFSKQDGNNFVDLKTDDGTFNYDVTGTYEYHFNTTKDYNDLNYIEFTNKKTGETFAGQFSSSSANPCVLKMVLISSKTGLVSTCTFDRKKNEPDLVCDP
ncbi:IPT/TIG domain-containing protein [Chitinophaga ginsengisoli]|uniref:IPT/TIG domain-containing protein n=1 Tax=Chitinophaga ginsengisoli TaxID=363837 RepID=A0A2P8FUQ7_9BACT|nr:IPT/TIG domain-containing protein [Chitinophaga ginsengisoli]PSL25453.1 hypothetical protein CLV42_113135 [Chitinophaga ginsengisoli]